MDLAAYLVPRRVSRKIVKLSSSLKQFLFSSHQHPPAYAGHVESDHLNSIRVAYPNVARWMQRHNQLHYIPEKNNPRRIGTSLFSAWFNRAREPFTATRTAIFSANRSGFFKRECLYSATRPITTPNSNRRDQLLRDAARRLRPVSHSLLDKDHGVVSPEDIYFRSPECSTKKNQ
ncbi:hypothetical protein Vretimale_7398 [Volvox reticuliferus]|uniref:Uncharacterized protein n=1 Tax=Volvox reticuliferus TaxID=1737510 RepID=A0A8J4G9C4_9CHLO|nr:hypothetical protein Vretifemale_7488 [Volvox reticuliferus]GIM02559.1 hypothetical protein Vretimale_7398 [Volvox reticuliferus]